MSLKKPNVIEKWQKKNKYGRPGTALKATKVAIHYTGSPDVSGKNTVSYFNNVVANGYKVNGKYVYASSHYVIDLNGDIYQLIPTNERCYATNKANSYAIAIEVATTGKDNHYTNETYKSMVHLVAWLCQYKGLDCTRDVITHTDVVGKSYKLCPIYMVKNPKKMEQFKLDCYNLKAGKITVNDIKNCTNGKEEVTKVPTQNKKFQIKVLCDNLNVRKVADWKADPITIVKKGQYLDVIATVDAKNGKTNMYKLESGLYITSSSKYVEKV